MQEMCRWRCIYKVNQACTKLEDTDTWRERAFTTIIAVSLSGYHLNGLAANGN